MPIYEAIKSGTWPDEMTFPPAVRAGNLLLISGTTSVDENQNVVGKGDIVAQTKIDIEKFGRFWQLLRAFDNVVETTEISSDIESR